MARNQRDFTIDTLLQLKDAGAIAADAAAQVGGAAKVLDLGLARVDARVIVDVSAIDVSSGDESYLIKTQFSNTADLSTGVVGGNCIHLGDSTVTLNTVDSVVGRYEIHFTNEINGVLYRYMRLFTDVGGTTPSINYTAWAVQDF